MDTVLNIPIEGYQSVGTIPLFWLRKNLNTGVEPGGELRRIFSSWLANGSAAERKGIVFGRQSNPTQAAIPPGWHRHAKLRTPTPL
jgi:hypothetical protein